MRPKAGVAAALLSAVLALGGCITYPPGWDPERGSDPYEATNRSLFGFNEGLDRYVIAPVAHGWAFITPEGLRVAFDKFFTNLGFPRRFVTNLGQAELVGAGSELGRFLLNTTVGLVGFFDPATHIGMAFYDEDFGQMFGRWGIPTGPYWVLPVFGPSNPRDAFGLVFDTVLDPAAYLFLITPFAPVAAFRGVNDRAVSDEEIKAAREAALNFYVSVRDGYIQRRQALVENRDAEEPAPGEAADELYEVEDELYEVDEVEGMSEPGGSNPLGKAREPRGEPDAGP